MPGRGDNQCRLGARLATAGLPFMTSCQALARDTWRQTTWFGPVLSGARPSAFRCPRRVPNEPPARLSSSLSGPLSSFTPLQPLSLSRNSSVPESDTASEAAGAREQTQTGWGRAGHTYIRRAGQGRAGRSGLGALPAPSWERGNHRSGPGLSVPACLHTGTPGSGKPPMSLAHSLLAGPTCQGAAQTQRASLGPPFVKSPLAVPFPILAEKGCRAPIPALPRTPATRGGSCHLSGPQAPHL